MSSKILCKIRDLPSSSSYRLNLSKLRLPRLQDNHQTTSADLNQKKRLPWALPLTKCLASSINASKSTKSVQFASVISRKAKKSLLFPVTPVTTSTQNASKSGQPKECTVLCAIKPSRQSNSQTWTKGSRSNSDLLNSTRRRILPSKRVTSPTMT